MKSPCTIFLLLICVIAASASSFHSVKLKDEDKFCKLHGEKLKKDIVPVVYGYVIDGTIEDEAREKLFPNSNRYVLGGCVEIPGESKDKTEVLYCSKCREAEKKWDEENDWKPLIDVQPNKSLQPMPGSLLFVLLAPVRQCVSLSTIEVSRSQPKNFLSLSIGIENSLLR